MSNVFFMTRHLETALGNVLQDRASAVQDWVRSTFVNHLKAGYSKFMDDCDLAQAKYTGKRYTRGPYVFYPLVPTSTERDGTCEVYHRGDSRLPYMNRILLELRQRDVAEDEEYEDEDEDEAPPRKIKNSIEQEIEKHHRLLPKQETDKLGKYHILPKTREMLVSNRHVQGRDNVLNFADVTPDMRKALANGAIIVNMWLGAPEERLLTHLCDFLSMYHDKHPEKQLSRISFAQLVTMVKAWDKELARQREEAALSQGTQILFSTEAGYKVFLLYEPAAIEREGKRLGNCLASNAARYLNSSSAIVVVRNPAGSTLAAAQLIVKLRVSNDALVTCIEQKQFYGRSNGAAPDEAVDALAQAAVHLNWRSLDDPISYFSPVAYTEQARPDDGDEDADEDDEDDEDGEIYIGDADYDDDVLLRARQL